MFSISSENCTEVFKLTQAHKDLMGFEKLCGDLWDRCVLAIRSQWDTPDDNIFFWSEDYDPPMKVAVMQRLSEIYHLYCFCRLSKDVCDYGKNLTKENFKRCVRVRAVENLTSLNMGDIKACQLGTLIRHSEDGTLKGKNMMEGADCGVLYVLWDGNQNVAIHASLDNIVFDSHTDKTRQRRNIVGDTVTVTVVIIRTVPHGPLPHLLYGNMEKCACN